MKKICKQQFPEPFKDIPLQQGLKHQRTVPRSPLRTFKDIPLQQGLKRLCKVMKDEHRVLLKTFHYNKD